MDSAKDLATGSKSSEEHFAAGLAFIQLGEYENALVEFSMDSNALEEVALPESVGRLNLAGQEPIRPRMLWRGTTP